MRILTVIVMVVVGTLYGADIAPAQTSRSIEVCGVDLKPGMAKDEVLRVVAAKCASQHLSAQGPEFDELWFLSSTDKRAGGNWTGSLYFSKGPLVTISSDIGSADSDAAGEIVNQIYILTKEAGNNGDLVTIVPLPEFERDGWRYRVTNISAGKRTLTLQTGQPIGKPNAISRITLQESLKR